MALTCSKVALLLQLSRLRLESHQCQVTVVRLQLKRIRLAVVVLISTMCWAFYLLIPFELVQIY